MMDDDGDDDERDVVMCPKNCLNAGKELIKSNDGVFCSLIE